jgi:hypothetical protein
MNGELRRRQTEDQPSATGIDVIEAEYLGHEGAIGISVATEDHDVGTEDHRATLLAPARRRKDSTRPEQSVRSPGASPPHGENRQCEQRLAQVGEQLDDRDPGIGRREVGPLWRMRVFRHPPSLT